MKKMVGLSSGQADVFRKILIKFNVKVEHNRPQLSHTGPADEYKAE